MNQKDERLKEVLRALVAEYFSRESNRTSLITVTGIELFSRNSRAKILITVLPEDQETAALDFAHRQLPGLREYVNSHARIMRTPFFDVAIDKGEKNRQKIEEIDKNI